MGGGGGGSGNVLSLTAQNLGDAVKKNAGALANPLVGIEQAAREGGKALGIEHNYNADLKNQVSTAGETAMGITAAKEDAAKRADEQKAQGAKNAAAAVEGAKTADLAAQAAANTRRRPKSTPALVAGNFAGATTSGTKTLLGQ